MFDNRLKDYYKSHTPIYDSVYQYPERQFDLRILESMAASQMAGLDVLEIAAGTGYWSQFIAPKASSLLCIDNNDVTLKQIARRTNNRQPPLTIKTQVVDLLHLENIQQKFNGCFAGLWLSHIPKQDWPALFESIHRLLVPGSKVMLIDNGLKQCDRLPISFTDALGNNYQDRKLDDGSIHRVIKNFPTQKELVDLIKDSSSEHFYQQLEHFWLFHYRVK